MAVLSPDGTSMVLMDLGEVLLGFSEINQNLQLFKTFDSLNAINIVILKYNLICQFGQLKK